MNEQETTSKTADVFDRRQDYEKEQAVNRTIEALIAASGQREVSNFDMDKVDDAKAAMMMDMVAQKKIQMMCPITINCVYLAVRETEVTDRETSEIVSRNRSILIDENGDVYATGSPVVSKVTLRLLRNKKARRKFDPPLPIHFSSVPVGGGAAYITATIAKEDMERIYG